MCVGGALAAVLLMLRAGIETGVFVSECVKRHIAVTHRCDGSQRKLSSSTLTVITSDKEERREQEGKARTSLD